MRKELINLQCQLTQWKKEAKTIITETKSIPNR